MVVSNETLQKQAADWIRLADQSLSTPASDGAVVFAENTFAL